jgi:hypothetical protein
MCPKPPDGTDNGAECLGPAPRTICVKPGTYQMTERLEFKKTRMGTASNRLTLQGDPNSSEKPLFDFSGQPRLDCGENPDNIGGLTMNAHYVTVKNLAIRGANDNCILVQGTEGIVENVLVYECADAGIQISSGGEYEGSGTNNSIINCDSHSNYDPQCDGENADGFAAKEGEGNGSRRNMAFILPTRPLQKLGGRGALPAEPLSANRQPRPAHRLVCHRLRPLNR